MVSHVVYKLTSATIDLYYKLRASGLYITVLLGVIRVFVVHYAPYLCTIT